MYKKHERIPSREMDRPMHLWRYGTYGLPLLVFPSAAGMAHEWDAHGMLEALGDLVEAGKLKPVVDQVLPLSEAAQAHRLLEDRRQFGKVVLTI